MKPSLSISEAALAVLLLAVLPLFVRNLLAIPVIAPLDPNEGWNAAHALAVMAGQALYPPPQSLMVNNYPPLSFYLMAALTRHGHDVIVMGRWLSMLAFVGTGACIALALRLMRCHWTAAAFGGAVLRRRAADHQRLCRHERSPAAGSCPADGRAAAAAAREADPFGAALCRQPFHQAQSAGPAAGERRVADLAGLSRRLFTSCSGWRR